MVLGIDPNKTVLIVELTVCLKDVNEDHRWKCKVFPAEVRSSIANIRFLTITGVPPRLKQTIIKKLQQTA